MSEKKQLPGISFPNEGDEASNNVLQKESEEKKYNNLLTITKNPPTIQYNTSPPILLVCN
jgi:hypothetical protein